ncbi:ribosome-associated protein, partial [Francisella tularensis]|nr:ribosome-associated protein [Francisella tularensis]
MGKVLDLYEIDRLEIEEEHFYYNTVKSKTSE